MQAHPRSGGHSKCPHRQPTSLNRDTMPVTRAMSRSVSCATLALPDELWLEILGHLSGPDLGSALSACRAFAALSNDAWRIACFRRWPSWSALAVEPGAQWRRQYELLSLRAAEERTVADVAAIKRLQKQVTERHRAILTEWLCEVSFDWALENPIVHNSVRYLDSYLQQREVTAVSRFQLLGLSCLRAAMGDARRPVMIGTACVDDKSLDPQRFAYISNDTYTPDEVEAFTKEVAQLVPAHLKTAPNAKLFLRSFWYRATLKEVAHPDEMHIYTLASFLLHLSLLDLTCSGFAASKLAAAALSVALGAYGKAEWPQSMQQYGSYSKEDLAECKARLVEMQATQEVAQLRQCWRAEHQKHAEPYQEYKAQWDRLLSIFTTCCRLLPYSPTTLAAAASTDVEDMQVDD